jgi:hypothetical protein
MKELKTLHRAMVKLPACPEVPKAFGIQGMKPVKFF